LRKERGWLWKKDSLPFEGGTGKEENKKTRRMGVGGESQVTNINSPCRISQPNSRKRRK